MRPKLKGFMVCIAATVLVGLAVNSTFGQENKLEETIKQLNLVTGNSVVLGEYKSLTTKPKHAKALLAYAKNLVKKNKEALNYNAAYILAESAKKMGDVKSSEVFYRVCAGKAVKLESTRKIVQSYGGLIDLLYEANKFGESAKVCRELLELETGPGKPRTVLVPFRTRFGTVTFIEDTNYDAVRQIKPGVHKLLIQAITKDGKFDKALRLVENLIQAKKHWQEYQLKAWVLREAGRTQQAADAYEEVLSKIVLDKELGKKERSFYEDRYRYLLSTLYVDLKKIDDASKQLQTLIDRNPDDPSYPNDLGYIWADNGVKLDKAEKLIRRAIELDRDRRKKQKVSPEEDRDNGAYLDSLGWVLFKKKKFKEAKEWLQKAVEDKRSQHIEIYDHLGDTHLALGDTEAAIAAWKRGIDVAGTTRREQQRKVAVEKKIKKHTK